MPAGRARSGTLAPCALHGEAAKLLGWGVECLLHGFPLARGVHPVEHRVELALQRSEHVAAPLCERTVFFKREQYGAWLGMPGDGHHARPRDGVEDAAERVLGV